MKVTLDLDELVKKGEITQQEADKLARLGQTETASLGANIMFGFGVVAVALGGWALFPTAQSVVIGGVIMFAFGLALVVNRAAKWAIFAQICMVLGALGIVGGIDWLVAQDLYVQFGLAIGLLAAAFAATSGLLAALAILQLAVALGNGTAYLHASYFFGVERPTVSIAVLGAVAIALLLASLRLPHAYERVALIAARTAVLMVNVGFLVGTLFGNSMLGWPGSYFTIAWALLLIGVGLWGVFVNRRWVVNTAAVFGAIHFYTQWFEYFGPNALSILGGGLLLIVFGFGILWFNNKLQARRAASTPVPA